MYIFKTHLMRNKTSLIIWSAVLSFMLSVCIIIYPEMSLQMDEMNDMLSNMGAFSDAFGITEISFSDFIGYFGVECGNTLGLGGAFFAVLLGISALSKEEKEKTAEFLLTHPIKRSTVVLQKFLSIIVQNVILSVVVALFCTLSTIIIGEKITLSFYLILLSFLILQIELSTITFCISAFISGNGIGISIGIAIGLYFINILSNLTDEVKFLKYITPFAYTDSGYILKNQNLDWKYMIIGFVVSLISIYLALKKYSKKDIRL